MSAPQTVTLDAQRAFGAKVITVLCWLFVPLVAIAAATHGGPWLALGLSASALAGAATLLARLDREGAAGRASLSVALMGGVSLLVASAGSAATPPAASPCWWPPMPASPGRSTSTWPISRRSRP